METEAKDLLAQGATASAGCWPPDRAAMSQIRAGLTIAADGRHSILRDKSGLKVKRSGRAVRCAVAAPAGGAGRSRGLVGQVKGGQIFVMIYRTDYWQCAYLIPKDGFDAIKAERAGANSAPG